MFTIFFFFLVAICMITVCKVSDSLLLVQCSDTACPLFYPSVGNFLLCNGSWATMRGDLKWGQDWCVK